MSSTICSGRCPARVFPDSRPLTWTVDQLGKAIFYIQRELNERFTTVLT